MRKGFSLVELLIVMTILAILMVMAIGILNPVALVNRGHDATRKKDLNRIKLAFEEYFNDKGCYPSNADSNILDSLMDPTNCNTDVFGSRFPIWPCDPTTKQPYYIYVGNPASDCPHWFMIYTGLQNHTDKDIPPNFYSTAVFYELAEGAITTEDANYGVSSPNTSWFKMILNPDCHDPFGGGCFQKNESDGSFTLLTPLENEYLNAYTTDDSKCKVDCCYKGDLCP